MRAIGFVVCSCVLALLLAGCGASLGPEDEGLELLPAPAQPPQPESTPTDSAADELAEPTESEALDGGGAPEPTAELEPEGPQVNPFSEAVRLLLRGRSARIAATTTNTLPGGGEFRVRSDGTFDVRLHRGATAVDGANLIRMLGEQGAAATAFVPGQLVFEEKAVYLNYQELPEAIPERLPWAVASFRQLIGRALWPDEGTVSALALTTPAHVAGFLTASRKTLVEIGREPVRGATAIHYQAVADLTKVPAAAPELVRGAIRIQMRALTAELGTSALPLDVWLDAKGRLRRVQFDLGAAAAAGSGDVGESAAAEQPTADEPVESGDSAAGEEPGAPEEQAASEEPGASEEAAATSPDTDGGEAAPDAQGKPAQSSTPSAVVVIDFIAFSGRVRADAPSAEETARYARVEALAQVIGASAAG